MIQQSDYQRERERRVCVKSIQWCLITDSFHCHASKFGDMEAREGMNEKHRCYA